MFVTSRVTRVCAAAAIAAGLAGTFACSSSPTSPDPTTQPGPAVQSTVHTSPTQSLVQASAHCPPGDTRDGQPSAASAA